MPLPLSRRQQNALQIATHIGALIPFAILILDYYRGNLTFNPIQEATFRTGKTALTLLVLSLACTPLRFLFDWKWVIRLRRPLGLYAFFYVCIHFLIFIWVDYGLVWAYIKEGLLEKPYALVGFTAFLLLTPVALTSTKGWQKRLGKNWTRLHKLVYIVGVLVIIHYLWEVKANLWPPIRWGTAMAILLLIRNASVKKWITAARTRYRRTRKVAAPPSGAAGETDSPAGPA